MPAKAGHSVRAYIGKSAYFCMQNGKGKVKIAVCYLWLMRVSGRWTSVREIPRKNPPHLVLLWAPPPTEQSLQQQYVYVWVPFTHTESRSRRTHSRWLSPPTINPKEGNKTGYLCVCPLHWTVQSTESATHGKRSPRAERRQIENAIDFQSVWRSDGRSFTNVYNVETLFGFGSRQLLRSLTQTRMDGLKKAVGSQSPLIYLIR